jgi:hypothetical protein
MKLILAVRIADTAPRGAAGAEQDAPLRRNAAYAGIGPIGCCGGCRNYLVGYVATPLRIMLRLKRRKFR